MNFNPRASSFLNCNEQHDIAIPTPDPDGESFLAIDMTVDRFADPALSIPCSSNISPRDTKRILMQREQLDLCEKDASE